jgi:DNA-binding transcriptional ArsR family regulator
MPGFDLDKGLKALACEPRRAIFELIHHPERSKSRPKDDEDTDICVCYLVEDSGLANSTVSHHLRVLKDTGLITGRKEGQWIHYRVNEANVDLLKALTQKL